MRPHHTQTRNMSMRNPIRRLLLHLRQHISHYFRILIPSTRRRGRNPIPSLLIPVLGPDDSHETQLRPRERVVQVVFQKVVLGQVGDVAGLDGGEEVDVRWVRGEGEDVDHFGGSSFVSSAFCFLLFGMEERCGRW